MSKNNNQKTSEEKTDQIPEDLARDLARTREEVLRIGDRAEIGWKVSAVLFGIVLAIIAGYLKFLVYDQVVVEFTQPDILTAQTINMVNDALVNAGAPELESGELPEWGAEKAIAKAPDIVENHVRPIVEEQLARLPELRQDLTARAEEELPKAIDDAVNGLANQTLPQARQALLDEVSKRLDQVLDETDRILSEIVGQVIVEQKDNIKVLRDQEVLQEAMAITFEDQIGEYVDEVFASVEPHIASSADTMEHLVREPDKTDKEKLELRILQLVYELYTQVAEGSELDLMKYDIQTGGDQLVDELLKGQDAGEAGGA